ncbi:MAG: acyl-CoA dehydrogenase [Rhodospirillaceae bacterium]|jgi:citronellyl-CoA dehydrogenase|nr:acyl-CoA dehydrogenase [Rhodospirillaceae bacterium]MBT4491444.1 acyl-CoA dehydrogenase [Rhodospirillaceae bacterium]MBT5193990.1 acyl-CoA dehydrogenase [Rhodospirillaceae bacterium]MBT5895841.1 acyl-CoA dehydrogenase [Rhodospirillaceae bacterium]MBT7757358.1 acyl-CoA dehydrogenase [Rhodospirillaceae bacterium]
MQETPEHMELRRTVANIVTNDINPFVDEWEEAEIMPLHDICKKMGQAGILGISKPSEFGGMDLDYSFEVVFAEEMGHARAQGVSTAIGVQSNMATPALATHGSDELRQEFLAPAIAGDLIGCIGVTEQGSGSDVSSVRSFARKDGDDYVINGDKMFITNSIQGDWICMLCNTSEDNGPHRNKTLIVVPLNSMGISKQKLKKLGLMCSDTGHLHFDDVRVPQRYRIGEEGMGFTYQMEQFQEERLYAVARTVTFLEDALEETIDYARQRMAFNRPILDNQVMHYKMAEMQSQLEAIRSLLYRATDIYVSGGNVTKLASMAKYLIGVAASEMPPQLLQFWGGQGYMAENRISRVFRDMKLVSIGGGANEVMQQIVAKEMGILPRRNS